MNIDNYINDGQDPKVVEKLLLKLQDMLTLGEAVTYIAVQKKPAITLFPDSIALTSKRLFVCKSTKLGLATNFDIFLWMDVKDISFKEGILSSTLTITPFKGETLITGHIPKNQARKLYQCAIESMEKDIVDEPVLQIKHADPDDELTQKLKKLKSLFERQLITQAEYENKKDELLSQL